MKAVQFGGVGRAETVEVDDATLRDAGDAIIRVEHTAICGSDLHPYRGEWGDPTGQRPGHEFIGTVVEVGPAVHNRRAGERVIVSGAIGCGTCPDCRRGLSAACARGFRVLGIPAMSPYPGGQAEYVTVPNADAGLLPLPDAMSAEAALLLTDNLATGWQGARRAGVGEGHQVAVVGFGPVGMCAAMSARELGAWDVFVIDPVEARRAFATELGCLALDVDDAVEQVTERTGGGADGVIETAGRDASVRAAVAMAHPTARISAVSVPSEPYAVPPAELVGPTQRFVETVASPPRAWREVIPRLGSAAFDRLDDVFSHRMALDDAADAYDLFANHPDACRKILFEP